MRPMQPPPAIARSGSAPAVLGGVFFAAYIAIQAFLAVSCLAADYGCLLTWTMYSGHSEDPDIFVEWKSGGEATLAEVQEKFGVGKVLGAKIDRAKWVPPHLCANLPDAQSVRLEFRRRSETIPCAP
jgi:hypothetical protein